MNLGYVIFYVADVAATAAFYEQAFGLTRRFTAESGQYIEMDTCMKVVLRGSVEKRPEPVGYLL